MCTCPVDVLQNPLMRLVLSFIREGRYVWYRDGRTLSSLQTFHIETQKMSDEDLPNTEENSLIFVLVTVKNTKKRHFLAPLPPSWSWAVKFTLHFSLHNKNNLLFYSDGAVRIQLWKQRTRHHSPSS